MRKIITLAVLFVVPASGAHAESVLDSLRSAISVSNSVMTPHLPEIKTFPAASAALKAGQKLEDFAGYHMGEFPKGFLRIRTLCFVRIRKESAGVIRFTIRDEDHETSFDKIFSLPALDQNISGAGARLTLTVTSTDGHEMIMMLNKDSGSSEIIDEVIISKNKKGIAYCGMMSGGDPEIILQESKEIYPADGIK